VLRPFENPCAGGRTAAVDKANWLAIRRYFSPRPLTTQRVWLDLTGENKKRPKMQEPPIDHLANAAALVAAAAHALRQEDMDPRRHIRAAKECLDQALQALEGPERVLWLDDWR